MRNVMSIVIGTALLTATSAAAEFAKVDSQEEFVALIQNKELRRPFVRRVCGRWRQ